MSRRAEANLSSPLAHFDPADLLDALSTGIVMLDAQLCTIYANAMAQDLLTFSLNAARGRPFSDFLRESTRVMGALRRAVECTEDVADRDLIVRPLCAPRDTHSLDVTVTLLEGQITGTHLLLELVEQAWSPRINLPSLK